MIPRYTRPEMAVIWEPQTRFKIWFEIEAHAADAQAELGGFLRDHTEFRLGVRRMGLDLEPDLEAGLGLPNGGHFRAGVAGNHCAL